MRTVKAIVVGLALAGPAAAADDPLARLAQAAPGKVACFARSYDDGHIARHRGQTVRRAVASVEDDPADGPIVRLGITRTDGTRLFAKAYCGDWQADVTRDGYVRSAFPHVRGGPGVVCWGYTSRESAREAGHFVVTFAAGDRSLVIDMDDAVLVRMPDLPGGPTWRTVAFGAQDRTMRVDPSAPAACAGLPALTGADQSSVRAR